MAWPKDPSKSLSSCSSVLTCLTILFTVMSMIILWWPSLATGSFDCLVYATGNWRDKQGIGRKRKTSTTLTSTIHRISARGHSIVVLMALEENDTLSLVCYITTSYHLKRGWLYTAAVQIWLYFGRTELNHEQSHNIRFLIKSNKTNTNEICIITFNGALLHVSAPGSHHQAKYNKPIPNYWTACYIISALQLDSYIHIQ
jgi:hypothetical protein